LRRQTRPQLETDRTSEARAIKRCEGDGEAIREIARSYTSPIAPFSRLAAEILCSSGPSNGTSGEMFWSAKPTAKQED
jgi:hypothetical protein